MGGRGASGGGGRTTQTESVDVGGRRMSLASFLSNQDIRRANDASIMDMGDNIKRTFLRYAQEVNGLDLTDERKAEVVRELGNLSTQALMDAAKAVNPYTSGPARLTTAQRTGSAADRAAQARGRVDSYMKQVRDESAKNARARESRNLASALSAAQKDGRLEVTVGGKTYYRARRNSSTWWVR